MTPYWLLVAHLVGDYLLQSDWMATVKTRATLPALAHAFTYVLPFVFLTHSLAVLGVIAGTHFLIDRFRLARYVVWAKNFLAPPWSIEQREVPSTPTTSSPGGYVNAYVRVTWWHPWAECAATGYHSSRPPWLAVWLLIIADNALHLIANGLALTYLS